MKLVPVIFFYVFVFQAHAQLADFKDINFDKADAIALKYKGEDLYNLNSLVEKLTEHLSTDVERFRAIYMWVCTNISNDYNLYSKNSRKRNRYLNDPILLETWNAEFKKEIFKQLVEKKQTICTGYAYLVKEMANIANIECEIVHGYGKTSTMNTDNITTPNHSWNAVKLQEKWYLCDPTWASGLIDPDSFKFKFDFREGLFLPSPDLFVMNHYPLDEKWMLLDNNKPTFETFLNAPLIYNKAYANLNSHIFPLEMHNTINRDNSISFKYKLAKSIDSSEVLLMIDDGNRTVEVKPLRTNIKDDLLIVEYQFDKRGFYDVHLLINNDLISTYTFRVKG
jgi:hypothetical protein